MLDCSRHTGEGRFDLGGEHSGNRFPSLVRSNERDRSVLKPEPDRTEVHHQSRTTKDRRTADAGMMPDHAPSGESRAAATARATSLAWRDTRSQRGSYDRVVVGRRRATSNVSKRLA